MKARTLTSAEAKNAHTREAVCRSQHNGQRRRNEDIRSGASTRHVHADQLLTAAIKNYFDGDGAALAAETQSGYRIALDVFERWAASESIWTCRQLTRGALAKFPGYVATKMKKRVRKPPYHGIFPTSPLATRAIPPLGWPQATTTRGSAAAPDSAL